MAVFMISEERMVSVEATEISHSEGCIIAWKYEDVVAIFRDSEVIGCWIERREN